MLTKSEIFKRKMMREEEFQEEKGKLIQHDSVKIGKEHNIMKEDPLNQPRHLVLDCPMFEECPADGKCRSFDLSNDDCKECVLVQEGLLCFKRYQLHSPANLALLYKHPDRKVLEVNANNE